MKRPKIVWLKRESFKSYSLPCPFSVNAVARYTDEKGKVREVSLEHLTKEVFRADEVGIFYAENWQGCKRGYGGFFFGEKENEPKRG